MSLYREGMEAVLGAGNLLTDQVTVYAVGAGYAYAADDVMADLTAASAIIGSGATLGSKTTTDGKFDAADPQWSDILGTDPDITQVVFTITVSATEYLLAHYDVTDLDPDGTVITYALDATNGVINFTGVGAVPGIPANVSAAAGDTEIDAGWDAPADNGSAITDYAVQYRTSGDAALDILLVGNSSQATSDDQALIDLFENRGDTVTLVADEDAEITSGYDVVVISESVLSATLANKYLASTMPVVSLDPYWLDGVSSPSSAWASGDPITGQRTNVYYLDDTEISWTGETVSTTVGIVETTADIFRTSASFGAGHLPFLAWSSVDTGLIVGGTYESGDTVYGGDTANARYAWAGIGEGALGVLTDEGRQLILDMVDWAANASTSSPGAWTDFTDGVDPATAATVTGLTNGTAYQVRVAAINANGQGDWSDPSSAATPSSGATGGGGGANGGTFNTFLQANHYDSGTLFDISNVPQAELDWMDTVVGNAQAVAAVTPNGANGIYRNNGGTETITGPTRVPRVGADGIKVERSTSLTVEDCLVEGPINLTAAVHSDALQVSFAGGAGQAECDLTRCVLNTISQNEVHGQGIKTGDGALGGGVYTDVAIIGGNYPIRLNNSGTYELNNVWLFNVRAILPYNGYATYDDMPDGQFLIISSGATINAWDVKVVSSDGTVRRIDENGVFSAYP